MELSGVRLLAQCLVVSGWLALGPDDRLVFESEAEHGRTLMPIVRELHLLLPYVYVLAEDECRS